MVKLNTSIVAARKPTILGIVTWGVPLAIMVHVLSLWQLWAGWGRTLPSTGLPSAPLTNEKDEATPPDSTGIDGTASPLQV